MQRADKFADDPFALGSLRFSNRTETLDVKTLNVQNVKSFSREASLGKIDNQNREILPIKRF